MPRMQSRKAFPLPNYVSCLVFIKNDHWLYNLFKSGAGRGVHEMIISTGCFKVENGGDDSCNNERSRGVNISGKYTFIKETSEG